MCLLITFVVATAAAHPLLIASRASPCSPGALVCEDSLHFGICPSYGDIIYQSVAAGTACSCGEGGACRIVAAGSSFTVPAVTISTSVSMSTSASAPAQTSTASSSAPAYTSSASPSQQTPSASDGAAYHQFNGDGSVQDGWPSMSEWLSFDDLWKSYQPELKTGCASYGVPNNTEDEIQQLRNELLATSHKGSIPAQFAMAIMMQESSGCLKVKTTTSPTANVRNPGIFQSHDGDGTCCDQSQCPPKQIRQMCEDGILGTSKGPGLAGCAQQAGSSGAEKWYRAARIYNSGSVPSNGNLGQDGATNCYASDVANRLLGWSQGVSQCTLDG